MKGYQRCAIATIVTLLVGVPASALDMMGRWDGTYSQPGYAGTFVLIITSQVSNAWGGWDLEGYFDWLCSSCSGRELVAGTLTQSLQFELTGHNLINPVNLTLGRYFADATPNFLINGTYEAVSNPGVQLGTWSGERPLAVEARTWSEIRALYRHRP